MTRTEWAHSVFKPDPAYKEPYPRWSWVLLITPRNNAKRAPQDEDFVPMFAYDDEAAIKQATSFARFMACELIGMKRLGPIDWKNFNKPWVKGSKENQSWHRQQPKPETKVKKKKVR